MMWRGLVVPRGVIHSSVTCEPSSIVSSPLLTRPRATVTEPGMTRSVRFVSPSKAP